MSVRQREWTTSKGETKTAWIVAYTDQHGKRHIETFKRKKEADAFAKQPYPGPGIDIEQHIRQKALRFIAQGIEPACYLYRHYHPSGELLYVGISMYPLSRQRQHARHADWRQVICRILIEPFETRQQALDAEQYAIRTEFPRFNNMHNGQRHPLQELARIEAPILTAQDQGGAA